jgi:hypothetical protein
MQTLCYEFLQGPSDPARSTSVQFSSVQFSSVQFSSVKRIELLQSLRTTTFASLTHGEFNIHGLRRADLSPHVPLSASALSRQLAHMRVLGLIRKVAHTCRYYLTRLGRATIAAACSLTRFNIIPALASVR